MLELRNVTKVVGASTHIDDVSLTLQHGSLNGFVNLILGDSAAQSVILMVIVIALTAIQFRYVERKVHYG